MLTITPAADAALSTLLHSPQVPDGAAVRIAPAAGPDGEPTIGMMIVEEPEIGDQPVQTGSGVDLYVADEAAAELDDKQLDVEVEGDQVAFSLQRQSLNGGPPASGAEPA
jgi:Fe-S cluster assembly iron-binding protein IscA